MEVEPSVLATQACMNRLTTRRHTPRVSHYQGDYPMALIEWNPAFSVKVKKFDDQHKKLVDLINELHDAMKAGEGNTLLGSVLQSLITYTGTHFSDEIKLMQANSYPELAKHKAEHDKFVAQVLEMQQKFQSGNAMLTMSTLSFLKEWLVKHIQGEDKKYTPFFNAKGIA
jgi:hemerythrin